MRAGGRGQNGEAVKTLKFCPLPREKSLEFKKNVYICRKVECMYYHEIHLVPRDPFQPDPFTRVVLFADQWGINLERATEFLSKVYPDFRVRMVSRFVPPFYKTDKLSEKWDVPSQFSYVHTDAHCPYVWHKISDGIGDSAYCFDTGNDSYINYNLLSYITSKYSL